MATLVPPPQPSAAPPPMKSTAPPAFQAPAAAPKAPPPAPAVKSPPPAPAVKSPPPAPAVPGKRSPFAPLTLNDDAKGPAKAKPQSPSVPPTNAGATPPQAPKPLAAEDPEVEEFQIEVVPDEADSDGSPTRAGIVVENEDNEPTLIASIKKKAG